MNLEQKTITSLEVAEMVSKDHKELLRDIRRYENQLKELSESNIALGDFFQASTYQDGNNQSRPCYLVTKKGCEFIGNKLTGIKGTEFTAKYINRFHDMEEIIRQPKSTMELLALEFEAIKEVNARIDKTDDRLDKLEFDIPLYGCESKELSDHVKRKGANVLGGKKSNAYQSTVIRSAVYRDIYDQIKREFGLFDESGRRQTYLALKRKYLADAHEFIDSYQTPTYMEEQIENVNRQMNMDEAV